MAQSALERLFTEAASRGFLKPTLRTELCKFKLAPATGRNPGAVYIYVLLEDEYVGKLLNNEFHWAANYRPSLFGIEVLNEVKDNPREVAVKWGHQSGQCSICGRRLDNAISVFNGIGPICAEKLGFPLATPPDNTATDLL